MAGTHTIEHGQTLQPFSVVTPPIDMLPDASIYSSDSPYPPDRYEVVGVQKCAGVTLLILNLHLVEYKPLSGTISYYKTAAIDVTTQAESDAGIPYRTTRMGHIANTVDNPETLNFYQAQPSGSEPFGICDPSGSYRYVLVTSKAIRDSGTDPDVNDLINHRKAQGMTGELPQKMLRNYRILFTKHWHTKMIRRLKKKALMAGELLCAEHLGKGLHGRNSIGRIHSRI